MAALGGVGEAIQRFIDAGPPSPALFAYIAAAALPVALLHELGHALVARRVRASARITLRATRHLLRARMRRLRLTASLLSQPACAGAGSFEAVRASAREVIAIALGGPIASLAGLAAAACGLASTAGHGRVHDWLWAATVTSFVAALGVIPLELREGRSGARLRTDGRLALEATRAQRSLSSPGKLPSPSWLPR